MVTIFPLLMLKIPNLSLLNKGKEMCLSLIVWLYHWRFPDCVYLRCCFLCCKYVKLTHNSNFRVSQTAIKLHAWQEFPLKCAYVEYFLYVGDKAHSPWSLDCCIYSVWMVPLSSSHLPLSRDFCLSWAFNDVAYVTPWNVWLISTFLYFLSYYMLATW